jgi:endonuclease/exonuclease/phosphatase family metal-dependent hydrolase
MDSNKRDRIEETMKKWLVRILKGIGIFVAVVLLASAYVRVQGVQYTLALVRNSWGKARFDSSAVTPEKNCAGITPCTSGPIRVLSYNVLCRICTEGSAEHHKLGFEGWYDRLPHIMAVIKEYKPDLLGLQEVGGWQDINELNPDPSLYEPLAHEVGPWVYGDAALFYRKDRFDALDSGQFWYGPTPDIPFAYEWRRLSMPRYLNWVHLRQKDNGFEFLYMNTHFDNAGVNKDPSALLVNKTFGPHAKRLPIIFTGDFNTKRSENPRYHNIMFGDGTEAVFKDALDLAAKPEELPALATSDGKRDDRPKTLDDVIDHIFLAGPGKNEVQRWVVDSRRYGSGADKSQSDHPAVFAIVDLAGR